LLAQLGDGRGLLGPAGRLSRWGGRRLRGPRQGARSGGDIVTPAPELALVFGTGRFRRAACAHVLFNRNRSAHHPQVPRLESPDPWWRPPSCERRSPPTPPRSRPSSTGPSSWRPSSSRGAAPRP